MLTPPHGLLFACFHVPCTAAPLVAVVILKDKSPAALEQPGCQGASCTRASRARVLVQQLEREVAAESPQKVADNAVYLVVILVLLTAFIIGVSMHGMQGGSVPTKATTLHSCPRGNCWRQQTLFGAPVILQPPLLTE